MSDYIIKNANGVTDETVKMNLELLLLKDLYLHGTIDDNIYAIAREKIIKESKGVREVTIMAHPLANVTGTIQIPNNITEEEDIEEYIREHFKDIKFGEPELDYMSIDFEYEDSLDEEEELIGSFV